MLREDQHVGPDWLATMYEKRLTGILADEVGLDKTLQTVALLAHFTCITVSEAVATICQESNAPYHRTTEL